jgi:hypothetical protein
VERRTEKPDRPVATSTPTPDPRPPSKAQRKSATDHLLRANSDPKIVVWLNRKEKEMRLVQKQKRREEKQQKRDAEAKAKKKEDQKKLAHEKYIEWSVKKLEMIRKQTKQNEVGKQACQRDSPVGESAFHEWLDKKKQQKKIQENDGKSPTQVTKSVSEEEKRRRYDEWMKAKRNLDREKARQKIKEEEEKQKREEDEEKCKEEERARRMSYNDWLKKKQETDTQIKKQLGEEEPNPFSDVARDLLIKRRMDKEMMKHRVNTGILINRPKVERRLRQSRRLVDATEVLGKYVEQIQLSETEQETINMPPVKLERKDLPQRLEPQGCEASEPASPTLNAGAGLSVDSSTLGSMRDRTEANEKAGEHVTCRRHKPND